MLVHVETRLGKEERPTEKLAMPPSVADNKPKYGPRIIPVMGAMTATALIDAPDKPTIGNNGIKERTTYNDAKQMAKAISFAFNSKVGNLLYLSILF